MPDTDSHVPAAHSGRARLRSTSPAEGLAETLKSLEALPKPFAAPVERGLAEVAGVLVEQASDQDVSSGELQAQVRAAIDAFTVIVRGDPLRLSAVVEALETAPVDDPDQIDVAEAEARARLRLQALYQKLIQESYSVPDLRQWRLSRQRLKQLRDEHRLFAVEVPFHKGLLYPRWQFDSAHRPRSILPTLIRAATEAGLDAIAFHETMTSAEAGDGTPPYRLLDEGKDELVVEILRAADH